MLKAIDTAIKVIRLFQNWWKVSFAFFHFKTNKQDLFILRNGIQFKTASTEDWTTINEVWSENIYNPPDCDMSHDFVVLDIGAHIGIFSIYAAKYFNNSIIYAYEPNSVNFALLKCNIKRNGLNNIKAHNLAVAGKPGRRLLFSAINDRGHSLFPGVSKSIGCEEIDCVTLKQILDSIKKCDFLKMDCEGSEYEIMLNTPIETLRSVRRISIECHEFKKQKNKELTIANNIIELKNHLEKAQFKVTLIRTIYTGDFIYLNAENPFFFSHEDFIK
jgi:FkbM family methyltransferase